jgi:arsenate reductase (glutaredoxin)
MPKIIVYEKPSCTTCRKVSKLLIENGVNFEKVNYYIEPFSKTQLQILLKKMKLKPSELLRTKEQVYKKLERKERKLSEEQILELMIKHPDLVQRPIVEVGNRAILARPPEKLNELFE